jgi:hypothetical protein
VEDLEKYLNDIVDPTVREFADNRASVRHAFIACVITCQAADYLAFPKRAAGVRKRWRDRSRDFRIVDDVGHAFKHVIVGDKQNPRLKAQEVLSRQPFVGDLAIGVSRFGVIREGVMLANDPLIDLLETVEAAVRFLREQLSAG